jgi:5-formyltetrahydrofolate cyclo-ligase
MSNNNNYNNTVTDKQVLRQQIRRKLKALTRDEIVRQSHQVWERLLALPQYQQAQSIGLFLSMPSSEICTKEICQHAWAMGKTIYVPQVGSNFEHADMELIRVVAVDKKDTSDDTVFYQDWPRNKWGIPEPPADMPRTVATPGSLDVIVVPGLAFDRHGHRLGQGKGYYDRFLQRIMIAHVQAPLLVAVALECQLADHVPTASYDHPMDILLLPNESITFTNTRT